MDKFWDYFFLREFLTVLGLFVSFEIFGKEQDCSTLLVVIWEGKQASDWSYWVVTWSSLFVK